MSSDYAIKVENLSKCYQIYDKPRYRLWQMLLRGRKKYFREFWALNDVGFEIQKGETVGIIGRNGSGKSTLLQMICGTLNPTSGSIKVNGRVAALLELGAGFNPEFTGRENVFLSASLYGLTRKEISLRFNEICEFADIGDFIDQPVKTYSSGMFVRLAFAVIAHVDADILVVDEALSVGDAYFVQKCMRFLRDFMGKGTLLFCSHDTSAIVNLCQTAILLNHGKMDMIGKPKDVSEQYLAKLYESIQGESRINHTIQAEESSESGEYIDNRQKIINASKLRNDIEIFNFDPNKLGFGTGNAKIISVRILDPLGVPLSWVVGGDEIIIEIKCKTFVKMTKPIVGFMLKDRLGQVLFADNTYLTYINEEVQINVGDEFIAQFLFRLPNLPSGNYSVSPAIAEGTQEEHIQHHWVHDALIIQVHASSICLGLIGIPMKSIKILIP